MANFSYLSDQHVVLGIIIPICELITFHDGGLSHVVFILPRFIKFILPQKFLLVVL